MREGTAEPDGDVRLPHVAFVMEQHLGHRTYAENLRATLQDRTDVRASWIPVSYSATTKWWEKIPFSDVKGALRGRREVKAGGRLDADVVVFNTQVPAVVGGRRARRHPYVLCMDDTPRLMDSMAEGYGHQVDRSRAVRWAKDRWNRRVLRSASALAPWSNWARLSLIRDYGVDPAVIEVIPPGVDISRWQPAVHSHDGPMRILFVGGDFERKGGPLLIDAFDALPPGSAELRIVTRSSVERRAGVEVYNDLAQNDPKLTQLFQTSDVFVLPSQCEMFGIAAVEAAAAGLPLIVSSVGGLGDLVIDGETGFSIAPGDRSGLIRHLRRLIGEPELRRDMGRAARQRAELEFDAAKNAQRLLGLALGCLDKPT